MNPTKPAGKNKGGPTASQESLIGGAPAAAAPTNGEPTSPVTDLVAPGSAGESGTELAFSSQDDDGLSILSAEDIVLIDQHNGLAELDQEDFAIGYWAYNLLKEVEVNGKKMTTSRAQFVNTLTGEVVDTLRMILLLMHKSFNWSRWSNKESKTLRFCQSDDRIHGRMLADVGSLKTGLVRPCQGCPQRVWKTITDPETSEQRRMQECTLTRTFMGIETSQMMPGVIRFKKTAEKFSKQILAQHFVNRWRRKVPKMIPRLVEGKPVVGADGKPEMVQAIVQEFTNYPLYAFELEFSLAMDKGGNFARPAAKVIREITKGEVPFLLSQAKGLQQMQERYMALADTQDQAIKDDEEAEAAGFDPSKLDGPGAGAPAGGGAADDGGFPD